MKVVTTALIYDCLRVLYRQLCARYTHCLVMGCVMVMTMIMMMMMMMMVMMYGVREQSSMATVIKHTANVQDELQAAHFQRIKLQQIDDMTEVYEEEKNDAKLPQHAHNTYGADDKANQVMMQLITDSNDTLVTDPWADMKQAVLHERCQSRFGQESTSLGLQASVIITYHPSEHLDNLLRTVHSVITRTLPRLLHDVILVDDGGNNATVSKGLEDYKQQHDTGGLLHIIHNPRSVGLIRARELGVERSSGDVIVFLDSHMEVMDKWLEPLLYEIYTDNNTIASAYLDWIYHNYDGSWEYRRGGSSWVTVWDLDMTFNYQDINTVHKAMRKDPSAAVQTPAMIGTAYAISREFWHHLRGFDNQMEGWGGENIHLSLKAWLCGGRVVYAPCSHVTHLESRGGRSYRAGWRKKIEANYHRLAKTWFDEYIPHFYRYYPHLKNSSRHVDVIEEDAQLQQTCRTMQWYLKEVYPQLGVPADDNTLAWGGLRNVHSGLCVTLDVSATRLSLADCYGATFRRQNFYWSTNGEVRTPLYALNHDSKQRPASLDLEKSTDYNDLEDEPTGYVIQQYYSLYGTGGASRWLHTQGGILQNKARRGLCLEVFDAARIRVGACNTSSPQQAWSFATYTQQYQSLTSLRRPNGFQRAQRELMLQHFPT